VEQQAAPVRWLRAIAGLRGDVYNFDVGDAGGGTRASTQAGLLSPKFTLVFAPVRTPSVAWDVYANFGRGFHSNDARGTVVTPTPALAAACADPARVPDGTRCPVTPLTPATGYEVGTRLNLFRRVDLSVAGWLLDLDQETVWVGDEGTTSVGGATRRFGLTVEARAQLLSWLWADVDASVVSARYTQAEPGADAVALAPPFVLTAGLSARHPSGFYGAARVRVISDRPADETNALRAQGFALASLAAGYRRGVWDLGINVENALNSTWREAQFAQTSRLRGEAAPVDDVHFTPGTPLAVTARLAVGWR
jgi:hypothetical protein